MNKIFSQQKVSLKKVRFRMFGVCFGFLSLFALVGARAFELHLTDNGKLSHLVKTQYRRRVVVAPKRGNILDQNGDTLALDLKVESVYATPYRMDDPRKTAQALSRVLSLPEKEILDRFADPQKKFVWIKRRVSPEESAALKKLEVSGFGVLPEYKRFYPNGSLAANLLGAVGYDAKALSGLELSYDDVLKSDNPPLLVEQDAKGRFYAPFALVGLESPNQLELTLDKNIQYIAERELQAAVRKAKAKGGEAIVLEPKTGAILAMAVAPTFDPNEYSKYALVNWRNRAITDVFEPGSIFKAFTAAAALETGVITLKQKIFCENGAMKVGGNTIHDHHGYGLLTLKEIVKFSSNICSFKLAQKIGKDRFYEILKGFGFGAPTGINAPGELAGLMAPLKTLGAVQLGTMGFGQGISVTPLQIVQGYGALANGGRLMKPYLVKNVLDSDGKILKSFKPKMIRQVVSEETASQTIKILETVVETGGTGTEAALAGYQVAGKTGTAQKVIEGQKGYAADKYVASFVGMAPSQNPRLVVLVSIDEPKGAYYGGAVSAPVFKKIMGQSLAYLRVPPEAEPLNKTKILVAEKLKEKRESSGKRNSTKEDAAKDKAKAKSSGILMAKDSEPGSRQGISSSPTRTVPDLTGLSVREALRQAQADNFKLEIRGTGICRHQEPSAGNPAEEGQAILLECRPPI